jgi:Flp pilus assembly protein TadG
MSNRKRRGAASVELALCLPLFVVVVFGAVELCSLIHLKETLKTASYEAARVAAKGSSFKQTAIDRATQIVSSRGITIESVTFEPSDLTTVAAGQYITATVSIDPSRQGSALMLPTATLGRTSVSSKTTMVKEKDS